MKLKSHHRTATIEDFRSHGKLKLNVPYFTRVNVHSKDLYPHKTNYVTDIASFKSMIRAGLVLVVKI